MCWGPAVPTDARLHRTGRSNPLGKCTAEFPKFKGPEEVFEILTERACRNGMTLAELLRELAMVSALGRDHVESLYRQRLDVVEGKGGE